MVKHLNQFLKNLQSKLPPICTDKDLIAHLPTVFRNSTNICRMRARGQIPPYFQIDPHVHYLRDDVINWLKERYQSTDGFNHVDEHIEVISQLEEVCIQK